MKKKIFIASSSNDHAKACMRKVEKWLCTAECEPHPWDKATTFAPGSHVLPAIREMCGGLDGAICIFAPDDYTLSKDKNFFVTRDNVVLEYGFLRAMLGDRRAISLWTTPEKDNTFAKVPTDILGENTIRMKFSNAASSLRAKKEILKWVTTLPQGNMRITLHGGMETTVANDPEAIAKLMEFYEHLLYELNRSSISINYCGREPLRTVIYDCLKHGYVENDYLQGRKQVVPRNQDEKALTGYVHYKHDADWIRWFWRRSGDGISVEPQFFNAVECIDKKSRLWAEYDQSELIVALNGDSNTINNLSVALNNNDYSAHPYKKVVILGWFSKELEGFHQKNIAMIRKEKIISTHSGADLRSYKEDWQSSPKPLAEQLAKVISDILYSGAHLR